MHFWEPSEKFVIASPAGNKNCWHHGCAPCRAGENWHTRANPLVYEWVVALMKVIGFMISNKPHDQYILEGSIMPKVKRAAHMGLIPRYNPQERMIAADDLWGPAGHTYEWRSTKVLEQELDQEVVEQNKRIRTARREEAVALRENGSRPGLRRKRQSMLSWRRAEGRPRKRKQLRGKMSRQLLARPLPSSSKFKNNAQRTCSYRLWSARTTEIRKTRQISNRCSALLKTK